MITPLQDEDELAKSGLFNLDDLEINRARQLSERQKRKLARQIWFWLGLAALQSIVMIALIAILVATRANILLGLAGLTFMLMLISSSLEQASPLQEDLRIDKVKSASGALRKGYGVSHGPARHSYIAHYNLRVNDQTFLISSAVYQRVREGESYRIYYVENSRTIVNIEPL